MSQVIMWSRAVRNRQTRFKTESIVTERGVISPSNFLPFPVTIYPLKKTPFQKTYNFEIISKMSIDLNLETQLP